MRLALRRTTLSLLVALVASLPVASSADEPSPFSESERLNRSKTLYEEGRSQFNLGNYAAAISAFERAYVLRPMPLFLYNLAQLSVLVGDRERAKNLYERFLDEAPAAPERGEVEARIRELKRSLALNPQPRKAIPSAVLPPPVVETPIVPPAKPSPSPGVVVDPVAVNPERPVRRRSRAWIAGVVVGSAVVVGGAIALGIVFGRRTIDPTPSLGRGTLQ